MAEDAPADWFGMCDVNRKFGYFPGTLRTEGVPGHSSDAYLISDYSFVDRDDKYWLAPASKDWTWNGASIPRVFWTFFGSPKVGCHHQASVLHDYYYQRADDHNYRRKQVDRMFYHGVRANGVGRVRAKTMYLALRIGGSGAFNRSGAVQEDSWSMEGYELQAQEAFLQSAASYIAAEDPELEQLDSLRPDSAALMQYR